MKQLTLLANKNGTDKGTIFREGHGYSEIYEDYIKGFIGKHPKILEIGIENGGSLRMWNDYFAGDCEIYAIDIVPEKRMYETQNTHIFIQDQSSKTDWENFKSQFPNNGEEFFDIIVEDGSHFPQHQIITLFELCNCVKKHEGIYVAEDLHTNILDGKESKFYLEGIDLSQTPLFSLMFHMNSPFLTEYENEYLLDKIKDITTYSMYRNKNGCFKDRSITSIINFK